jgi:hypothetical protein
MERIDVVSQCIDRGINYIDVCTGSEVMVSSRALKGRQDKMHVGFSWFEEEMRNADCRTTDKLLGVLEKGMRQEPAWLFATSSAIPPSPLRSPGSLTASRLIMWPELLKSAGNWTNRRGPI